MNGWRHDQNIALTRLRHTHEPYIQAHALEIVIAATVVIMTAVALMFIFSDQAGNFGQWANDTQQGASCDLYKTNYELACNCEAENDNDYQTQGTVEAESKAESESCSWVGDFTCEKSVCG